MELEPLAELKGRWHYAGDIRFLKRIRRETKRYLKKPLPDGLLATVRTVRQDVDVLLEAFRKGGVPAKVIDETRKRLLENLGIVREALQQNKNRLPEYDPKLRSYGHQLFYDGSAMYNALVRDIQRAQHTIYLESYIFEPDAVGKRIANALLAKAQEFSGRQETKIILVLDGLGSPQNKLKTPEFNQLVATLRAHNIQVHLFNQPRKVLTEYDAFSVLKHPLRSLFGRNHRKLVVIDNAIAYLGGMNIGEQYLRIRDTHLRITGAPVAELANSFLHSLTVCTKYEYHALRGEDRQEVKARYKELKKSVAEVGEPRRFACNIVDNTPSFRRHDVRDEYVRFIHAANKTIFITNAYFIPGWKTVFALVRAARRGVDVRVILPAHSDHATVDSARRAFYPRLLKSGVRIYHYEKPGIVLMHAKTMTVDGRYVTIGSSNLDYVSLSLNYELNLFLADEQLAQELDRQSLLDLQSCTEVVREEFFKEKRSLKERVVHFVSYLVLVPLLRPGNDYA